MRLFCCIMYINMSKIEELKAELKTLGREYAKIKTLPESERKAFGEQLNARKTLFSPPSNFIFQI